MKRQFLSLISIALLISILSSCKEPQKPVSDKKEFVPEWAKKVVWYQIFPERFRNGDAKNDPKVEDQEGAWPHDITNPWQIHPWGADWYEPQTWEQKNGKDIWYNLQRRRYGGDLQGIIDKLDYIKELGIGAIYLNPIFDSPSLHKYDGASYHHVDPTFGPDPEGDRKLMATENANDPKTWVWTSADKLVLKLIEETHKRGMYIIFDGVFNHLGINSFAFKDIKKNQEKSIYKDWFTVKSWDDAAKGTKFEYQGWFGVPELPEIKEDSTGIVKGPKEYIFAATERWMQPQMDGQKMQGIDGWRLDVAFCVGHPFWKDWRKKVRTLNAEAYLTAEVVDSIDANKPYLQGDEFDAVMNYNFAFYTSEFLINKEKQISASVFDKKLKALRDAFPEGVSYVMQNLMDSHDSHRMASFIVNPDIGLFADWGKGFYDVSKGNNPKYDTRKPTAEEYNIQKLIVIFQMTYLGAPMVYYGDEVGMWGANDPCPRKPMIWDDIKYNDELYLPNGKKREKGDKVEVNKELLDHYKKLISIRNSNPALQLGDFKTLLTNDQKKIYAFSRNYQNESVIIVINNSGEKQEIELPMEIKSDFADVLNNNQIVKSENGKLKLSIPAKWASILKVAH